MPEPSPEQQQIIDDTSRIRIVRAAPGSGKTWLIGKIIQKELETWNKSGGIAALSFTRVGGEEIRKAVGYELDTPHFVGTLDSFLFRYIVKPFLSKCSGYKEPRLIPAFYGSEFWANKNIKHEIFENGKFKCYNLLDIDYGINENKTPKLLYSFHGGEKKEIPQLYCNEILEKKKNIWRTLGWVSHQDVHYLACGLLKCPSGRKIISELEKRFPFIIVDELQDTGYYICEFLRILLAKSSIKALLVGDPNQSIYEFNGATPEMFNTFKELNGANEISLQESRRCPQNVIKVANNIIHCSSPITTIKKEAGGTTMVCYNASNFAGEVNHIIKKIQSIYPPKKCIKAIARNTATINELKNVTNKKISSIGSPELTRITRGIQYFLSYQNNKALCQISDALSSILFNQEGLCEDDLQNKNINPFLWKQLTCEILLTCTKERVNQVTYKQWQEKAKDDVVNILKKNTFLRQFIDEGVLNKLKNPQNRGDAGEQMSLFLQIPTISTEVPLLTVHGVKGETHDTTIFIVPPKKNGVSILSDLLWSNDLSKEEEKRIAYVACTRTRENLYLIVSKETEQSLKEMRRDFYDCFEVKTVEDFVSASQSLKS